MKESELEGVVTYLKKALAILDAAGIGDREIVSKYANYLVALKLVQKGYEVRVPGEKGKRGRYDIHILNKGIGVEVKSGRYTSSYDPSYDSCAASFRQGEQIKQKRFHYCAFVTFRGNREREIFVFSLEELKEVADNPRPEIADYENNTCFVLKFADFEKGARAMGEKLLQIEAQLHKQPEMFLNRWDKIT